MHVIQVLEALPRNIEGLEGFVEARAALEKDPNANVVMLINCPGGNEVVMREMVKFLRKYPIPVAAAGQCSSAAIYLLAAGKKGHRFIEPGTQITAHLGILATQLRDEDLKSGRMILTAYEVRILHKKILDIEEWASDFWRTNLGLSPEDLPSSTLLNVYAPDEDREYTPEEAVELQIADSMMPPAWIDEAINIVTSKEAQLKAAKAQTDAILSKLQYLLPKLAAS